MPKINEPSRVIMRGRTRTIGEPRRPQEGAGTPAERAAVSSADRRIGKPRSSDDGQGRFAQGEAAPPRPRNVPQNVPQDEPRPRTTTDERRPLDRIAELERRAEASEAAFALLAETVGGLVQRVGDSGTDERPASGLVAIVSDLAGRRLDTERPPLQAEEAPGS